jgi:hypothetical protein
MADENVLAEKEFDIPVDDNIHDVAPQERGIYILNFALGGQHAETTSLMRLIIREKEQDELPRSPLVREKSRHL